MRSVLAISVLLAVPALPAAADAGVRPGKYVAKSKGFAKSLRKQRMVSLWLTRKRVNDVDFRVFENGCNLGPNSLYGRAGGQIFEPHKQWNRHGRLRKGRIRYAEHRRERFDALGNPIDGRWNQIVTGRVEGNRIIGTFTWKVTRIFFYGEGLKKKRKFACKGQWDFKAKWRSRATEGPSARQPTGPREGVPEEGDWTAIWDPNPDSDADPLYDIHLALLDDHRWHVEARVGTPCGVAEAVWVIPVDGNAIEGGTAAAHVPADYQPPYAPPASFTVSGSASLSATWVRVNGDSLDPVRGTVTWNADFGGQPPHCPASVHQTWANFEARYTNEGD